MINPFVNAWFVGTMLSYGSTQLFLGATQQKNWHGSPLNKAGMPHRYVRSEDIPDSFEERARIEREWRRS